MMLCHGFAMVIYPHHDIDPLAIKWSDQINLVTCLTQAKGMTVKQ